MLHEPCNGKRSGPFELRRAIMNAGSSRATNEAFLACRNRPFTTHLRPS